MADFFPLGRVQEFDERSRQFPIRSLLQTRVPRSYTWSCSPTLDQGIEGTCVGFAWAHELAARPAIWNVNRMMARAFYKEATQIDPWPENDGPDMEFGTSILAGAKTVQGFGYIDEYRWAFGIADLVLALGYAGPAVLGLNWHEGMFTPDDKGIIRPEGPAMGGHAILANGLDLRNGLIRLHNSWGPTWGKKGQAFISIEDLGSLLSAGGEACIPITRTTRR